MPQYRCYYFDRYASSRAANFEADSDAEAIGAAELLIARADGNGGYFEIWNRDVLVHRVGERSPLLSRDNPSPSADPSPGEASPQNRR